MTQTFLIELPDELADEFRIWKIKSQHRTNNIAMAAAIRKGIRK